MAGLMAIVIHPQAIHSGLMSLVISGFADGDGGNDDDDDGTALPF